MKRLLTLLTSFGLVPLLAQAQFFTNGNLAIVSVGTPSVSGTSTNGLPVTILQLTTNGTLVSSLSLSNTGTGAFTLTGGFTEGLCTLSRDGQHLVLPGYNAPLPLTGGPAAATSTNAPRAVVMIDGLGNVTMPIINTNLLSTYNFRGAATDGTNFWGCGSGGQTVSGKGALYLGTAGQDIPPVQVGVTGTGNERCLQVVSNFQGNGGYSLFMSTGSTHPGVNQVVANGFPPTTSVNTNMNFIISDSGSPYDFAFDPTGTICFVADSTYGIIKFTYNGGSWVSNYTLTTLTTNGTGGPNGAEGIAVDFTQSPAVIYATTEESPGNRLVSIVDNPTLANATLLYQANNSPALGTNFLRGIRFVPSTAPVISSQPVTETTSASGSATFSISVTASPAATYQWYTNGVAVAGATASSFTMYPVTTYQNGETVSVVASNPYGSVTSSNVTLTVTPNYFTPGNLAVLDVGGNGQPVSSSDTGNTVSIIQYSTSGGAAVSTLAIPSTGPSALLLDGSTTEGYLTLTPNQQFLVFGGYNTAYPGAYGRLSYTTNTQVARAIATVDGYGNYTLEITNGAYSTWDISSAVSDGNGNFWEAGQGTAGNTLSNVIYAGTAANPQAVVIGTTGVPEESVLNIYNNNMYVSSSYAPCGIYQISNASETLPTNATGTTVSAIVPLPSSSRVADYVLNSAGTVLYQADTSLGIIKWTYNGSAWVSNYTISGATAGFTTKGCIGLTADFTQNPPVVYATTDESAGNRLIKLVDSGSTATPVFLEQAYINSSTATTNVFRGVRFIPGAVPEITSQPANFIQDAGASATFSVTASGTPTLAYQWYTNNAAVPGATGSSLTLANLTLAQNNSTVYAVVSNNFGSATSSNATLSVQPAGAPLNVSLSPSSQTASAGSTVTINVSAVGTSLTFIWYQNGVQVAETSGPLVINPAYATADGTYTVLASNSFGTSPGQNSATVTVIDPVILVPPAGSTNFLGGATNLTVTAAGSPTLTYQWYSNGVAIAGATTSSLSLANSGNASSASYTVTVKNGLGQSVSSSSTVVQFTPYLLYDNFNYPNGDLFAESSWVDINGSNPELVTNSRVQINQTNATTDGERMYVEPVNGTVVWASFTINLTQLPTNANGTYFASFSDTNFGFSGALFAVTANAFPGTYRLGMANNHTDYANGSGGPTAVVPEDLAPGINYDVVMYFDMNNQFCGVSVNPAGYSDAYSYSQLPINSGPTQDGFTFSFGPMDEFVLRQRQGEGVMTLGNLEVSYDYNGAGSGYSVVSNNVVAGKPVIGFQPQGVTNYSGNNYTMEVAASGMGAPGTGLTYTWYQNGSVLTDGADGGTVSGSATQAITFTGLSAADDGSYYAVVSSAYGMSTSATAVVSVNTTQTAPFFTQTPVNSTNSEGTTVTFSGSASGTGPITYQWLFDGNPLSDNGSTIVGSQTSTLTLSTLLMGEAGTYTLMASSPVSPSASASATLTVTAPAQVTIGYLRSLLNPSTYTVSDTSDLFTITGTITTFTNLTSGNTASYYIQDATGGLNLFLTFGSTFRPQAGDEVTATGVLSVYGDNLEMDVTYGSQPQNAAIVLNGNGNPVTNSLPTPILLPWNYIAANQNYVITNIEGSLVKLTNVYFETPGVDFVAGTTYTVSNASGQTFSLFLSAQDTNMNNIVVPAFAYSVSGPLWQDDATFELELTDASEIVTNAPALPPAPQVSAAATVSAGVTHVTLQWTAVPNQYSYSVLYSTNVQGPWAALATGLTFSTSAGSYTDVNGTNITRFYQVRSP